MRINNFNINYKQHSTKQNARVQANTFLARNNENILNADKFVFANRPDLSSPKKYRATSTFTTFTAHVPKPEMDDLLKHFGSKKYSIRLFDRKTGEGIPAFIKYRHKDYALNIYDINGSGEHQELGNVNLSSILCFKQSIMYTALSSLKSKNRLYGGIGSNLVQAVVELGLQTKNEGRIYLQAYNYTNPSVGDPFVFYKKMGFTMQRLNDESPDLRTYIRRAEVFFTPSAKGERFLDSLQKLKGQDFASMPVDEKMLAIYETIAHHQHCTMDQIRLDFNEKMFLNDDAIKTFWTPRIQANRIFSDRNRL